ncbi:unnamed protein product, partial [Cuscuta europaea]
MVQLGRDNSPEELTHKQILEKVLGRESVRLFGWGRSSSENKKRKDDSNVPIYTELLNHVGELQSTVGMMQKLLIEKNILPPGANIASDHCSRALNGGSTSIGRDQQFHGYEDSISEFDEFSPLQLRPRSYSTHTKAPPEGTRTLRPAQPSQRTPKVRKGE